MNRHFELWDTGTGNLMATFLSEAEALTVVRETIRQDGAHTVEAWALGWEDEQGEGGQIAAGGVLAERALSVLTT